MYAGSSGKWAVVSGMQGTKGERMSKYPKELARFKKISIGILDTMNCYVAEVSKYKEGKLKGQEELRGMRYYSTLSNALRAACERVARRDCKTLEDYIKIYEDSSNRLDVLSRKESENAGETDKSAEEEAELDEEQGGEDAEQPSEGQDGEAGESNEGGSAEGGIRVGEQVDPF